MDIVNFAVIIIFLIGLVCAIMVLHQNIKKKSLFRKEKVTISNKRKNEIRQAIEDALKNNSFEVYYQPVFNKFDELKAAEALLRLNDKKRGYISPDEFIPVAIETGKMEQLSMLVIEQVAGFIKNNDLDKLGLSYIEVNLSHQECQNENLAEYINEILDRHEIDKKFINLQIPEKTLSDNHTVLLKNMQKLSEDGIKFSLDDYGADSGTLAYIMTLPFQFVKIDRSVLWTALSDHTSMQIFGSSIDTLKDFSMNIVVEGVESKEVAEDLKRLGCDYLQGYYYAKPLSAKDFADFCLTLDKA